MLPVTTHRDQRPAPRSVRPTQTVLSPRGAGGGGGGTHPGFGYPQQNGSRELWLSMRSRQRKRGAVTDPSTLRRGLSEGAYSVGAVVFGLSSPRKASWISHSYSFDYNFRGNCIRIAEK